MTQAERNRIDAEMANYPSFFGGFTYAEWLAAQPAEFLAEWYATLANAEAA
jgi:hypothetical protein